MCVDYPDGRGKIYCGDGGDADVPHYDDRAFRGPHDHGSHLRDRGYDQEPRTLRATEFIKISVQPSVGTVLGMRYFA